MAVFQGSTAIHPFSDSLGRFPGLRMVVLMVVVYYRKRTYSWIPKGKRHISWSLEESRRRGLKFSPLGKRGEAAQNTLFLQ